MRTRWKTHRTMLRTGTHHTCYLQAAWNKYGEDAFSFEVLEECSRDVLTEREQWWIDNLRPAFNMALTAGNASWTGRRHSPETLSKMSAAHKGKQYALGTVRPADVRAKMSARLMGHPVSAETRAKIAAVHAGKKLSPEHRAAISAFHKGRPKSAETRARISAATRANLVGPARENASKTHCKHGHEFTPENTHISPHGRRICRACKREDMRARREVKKERS